MTEAEIAWCAGLFEGEGSIGFIHENGVQVVVVMNDRDVLERFDSIFPSPAGLKPMTVRAHQHRQSYKWQRAARNDVREFLLLLLPYLGKRRRARANEALARLERNCGHRFGRVPSKA